jgi:hypothetical protein
MQEGTDEDTCKTEARWILWNCESTWAVGFLLDQWDTGYHRFYAICLSCFWVILLRIAALLQATAVTLPGKWSRCRSGVTQRVGRGIALLFLDHDTRRRWVVSSTSRPHFTPGKDPVPIAQEAGWASGPVWKGGKSRPHRYSIPDRPSRSKVVIPTELPGSQLLRYQPFTKSSFLISLDEK